MVRNLPVFLSDESEVQLLVDDHFNLGGESDDERNVRVVRIRDFDVWMSDNPLNLTKPKRSRIGFKAADHCDE